jgi:hypothetical protein
MFTGVVSQSLLAIGSSSDFASFCIALRYRISFLHYLRVFRPVREDKQYAANDQNHANRSQGSNSDAFKQRFLANIQNCITNMSLYAYERLLLAERSQRRSG